MGQLRGRKLRQITSLHNTYEAPQAQRIKPGGKPEGLALAFKFFVCSDGRKAQAFIALYSAEIVCFDVQTNVINCPQ